MNIGPVNSVTKLLNTTSKHHFKKNSSHLRILNSSLLLIPREHHNNFKYLTPHYKLKIRRSSNYNNNINNILTPKVLINQKLFNTPNQCLHRHHSFKFLANSLLFFDSHRFQLFVPPPILFNLELKSTRYHQFNFNNSENSATSDQSRIWKEKVVNIGCFNSKQNNYSYKSRFGFQNSARSRSMAPIPVKDQINHFLDKNKVMVFAKSYCPYCHKVEDYLIENKIPFEQLDLDLEKNGQEIQDGLFDLTGQKTVPNVFINGNHVGGCDRFFELVKANKIRDLLDHPSGSLSKDKKDIRQPLNIKDGQSGGNKDSSSKFETSLTDMIKYDIDKNKVILFAKSYCPFCHRVEEYLYEHKIPFKQVDLDKLGEKGKEIQEKLGEMTGQKTVPNLFINGKHVGGCDKFIELVDQDKLNFLLDNKDPSKIDSVTSATDDKELEELNKGTYDYDLIVIGGGSGGMSCSKNAADLGAKVAVFDFIVPTPIGTTWGLGGTCVNVGCIPKKLMHRAALCKDFTDDAVKFGWNFLESSKNRNKNESNNSTIPPTTATATTRDTVDDKGVPQTFSNPDRISNWDTLVQGIQDYIHSLNFKYKSALREKNVKYFNCYARFVDPHTIYAKEKNGKEIQVTGKYILIASGIRPTYLSIPGAREYCITSDDIFSLSYPPGKTLLIGASYIALECAGFLNGLGYQTSVMVRSILLRNFDRQMAELIGKYMAQHGVTFIQPAEPYKIEKIGDSEELPAKLKVYYKIKKEDGSEEDKIEYFNTVVIAIGREAKTEGMDIEKSGVKLNSKNLKVIVDDHERSSVYHIFALGDNADGRPELTPSAVAAGKLLAQRLFDNSKTLCDYDDVPTTVFTPLEYGTCGFSEEKAIEKFGKNDIEVYHTFFKPLEWTLPQREESACYGKLIVVKSLKKKVVGFHYLGPNAGEITQGYAVAFKMGAKKADYDRTIAIHPTQSETFIDMTTTKGSGKESSAGGC